MIAVDMKTRPQYDLPTAVTFLLAGLGLGSVLTLLFASRSNDGQLFPPDVLRRTRRQ